MSGAVSLELRGASEVNARFSEVKDAVIPFLTRAINKGTALVSARAKYRCPVDTGALRNSIHIRPALLIGGEVRGIVYTSKEYAAFVEFGTGRRGGYPYSTMVPLTYTAERAGQIAQPYLMPALLESKTEIQRFVNQAVRDAAMKGGK